MKIRNLVLTGCMFLAGSMVFAQEEGKAEEAVVEQKAHANKSPEDRAKAQTAKLKEVLDLTAEQEEQVYHLNLKVAQKIKAIKEDNEMSDERKKEFIQGNKKDHKSVMKVILTEEQFAEYEEFLAAKKDLRGKMHPEQKEKPESNTAPEKE